MIRRPPRSTLLPCTTLFRSQAARGRSRGAAAAGGRAPPPRPGLSGDRRAGRAEPDRGDRHLPALRGRGRERADEQAARPRAGRDEQRLLDAAREAEVQGLVRCHTPDELDLPFAPWSRAAVRMLIARRCGVALAVRTVGKYLARWGFTAQKPIRRAYEQDR